MTALCFLQRQIVKIIVVLMIVSTTLNSYGQPPDPQNGDPDNPVPIPGIAYLLLGGLILGIKKIVGIRKQKANE
jgi:hypothetical protein